MPASGSFSLISAFLTKVTHDYAGMFRMPANIIDLTAGCLVEKNFLVYVFVSVFRLWRLV